MGRQQLLHPLEQRLAVQAKLEGEVIVEALQVGLDLVEERQDGLGLGSNIQDIVHERVIEGLDAEAIAGTEQGRVGLIPQGESKHAAKVIDALLTPAAVGVQNHLGIGGSAETFFSEGPAQLQVVVD